AGWHWNCHGTNSGARSHDPARQPHHRAICPRRSLAFRAGSEESQLSAKAEPLADNGESLTKGKMPGAAHAAVRLAKLLRGVDIQADTKIVSAYGDLEILQIAYDSHQVKAGTLFVAIRGE